MKRLAAVSLALFMGLLSMGHAPAQRSKADNAPDARELSAHFMLDGVTPYTLRGWRVDYLKEAATAGDCPWVFASYDVRVSRVSEVQYYHAFVTFCDGYYMSMKRADKSTERERAFDSKEEPTAVRQTKPAFGLHEIQTKGALIKSPVGMFWSSYGPDGVSKTSVTVKLADGSDDWEFMIWQDKQGVIHLEPSEMERMTYTYKR